MVRIIMKIIYLKKNINIWKESEKGKECREMLAEWNWQERKEKSIMTERKRVRRSGEGDLKLLHKLYNVKIIIVCKVEKKSPFFIHWQLTWGYCVERGNDSFVWNKERFASCLDK